MISPMVWLSLSQDTRRKIALLLEIPRSGGMEVVGGSVVSDGYTPQNLATVTLARLQAFMGEPEEQDFYKLFNALVRNVELPPVEIKTVPADTVVDLSSFKNKSLPFCDQCDSKGVRHLKTCPRNT